MRVEVWDKDPIQDDVVGSDVTDEQGTFSIEFDTSYFDKPCFDREPDVYFKVSRGKQLLTSTKPSEMWNIKKAEKPVTLSVNLANENYPPFLDLSAYKTESFIPEKNINAIYGVVTKIWPNGKQQKKQRKIIANLECEAAIFSLLWKDARGYLEGDTPAGDRLLAQLNNITSDRLMFAKTGPTADNSQVQPISGESGFIPNPRLPGRGFPCLFPPMRLPDIYFAIARFIELVPDAPRELVDTYFGRVQNLVRRLAPLETVHRATQLVLNGQLGAENYFKVSLESAGGLPGTNNRQPVAMSFSGFPAPFLPQEPFQVFDLCRAEQQQETADAVVCFRRLQDAPRYEIDDIVNITKDSGFNNFPIIRFSRYSDIVPLR